MAFPQRNIALIFIISLVLCNSYSVYSECPYPIILEDFENDSFSKWQVIGKAFGKAPATGFIEGQQHVTGYEGKRFANSFHGGDGSLGKLISQEFIIERNYINFLLGGGMKDNTFIELIIDGESVCVSHPIIEKETLNWLSWDVRKYLGKKARINVIDNQSGGWGHILVDQIEMSNQCRSNILKDFKISFIINKKFLLIPIEENATESKVQILVDDKAESHHLQMRIAHNKVDYWLPISVSKYKGKKLTLLFQYINKFNIGGSLIKQSNNFKYDYTEKYRPTYHFTPEYGWMNDPNGLVYYAGEYHLFYQYNPYGCVWGNMHWGHAVSKDLIHWHPRSIALHPDSIGTIFSGSAIVDRENLAGFGKNALIAIYTSDGNGQTQNIAHSLDNGYNFQKYDLNPVLKDSNKSDFRDPKVCWYEKSKQWIMTLATGQTISFYGSQDLKKWNKLSDFGEGIGAHGGVWECPDLFPLTYKGKTKWILIVSISPGGPNGGSATQYFIGNFDGTTFMADNLPYPLWLDYGRDNYAGVTWNNIPKSDGRTLFIGWMNNWDYANFIPQINFRGSMTIVRELKLMHNGTHLILSSNPVKEVTNLRKKIKEFAEIKMNNIYDLKNVIQSKSGAYEIDMTIKPEMSTVFNFSISNMVGEKVCFLFNLEKASFSIDRSKSGIVDFNQHFASHAFESPLRKKTEYKLQIFVDKSSVECFINEGELVQTNIVFPNVIYNSLHFETDKEISIKDLSIYKIEK